mgnify:CR=1 FL=1
MCFAAARARHDSQVTAGDGHRDDGSLHLRGLLERHVCERQSQAVLQRKFLEHGGLRSSTIKWVDSLAQKAGGMLPEPVCDCASAHR